VNVCITLSICFWLAVAYFADAPWLYLASGILGPVTGARLLNSPALAATHLAPPGGSAVLNQND
jgi:hypothetical protein